MVKLKNDRLIRALLKQKVDRTPIWVMRQAGRYLPEYRATRAKAGDFMSLCRNPELACEVTLQPLQRFPLDGAIIFSDILTIPDAMGLGLYFTPGEGPRFENPITNERDIAKLTKPDPEVELRYVMDALRLTRKTLAGLVPLIGFSGSPWTLATYMVEGGASKNFSKIKNLLYQNPAALHQLLDVLAHSVVDYLTAQAKAGAQVLMLFDTWGGILSTDAYLTFSLAYMRLIIKHLNENLNENLKNRVGDNKIPIILFSKGGGLWLDAIADSGCDAVGLDWTVDMAYARSIIGDRVAIQGNMDPNVLYANEEALKKQVIKVLAGFGKGNGHVFNLGHGILPDVNPDKMLALVNAVHKYSMEYHR